MASLLSSPSLPFDTTPASPLSSPSSLQQQQGGDDGDAIARALEKLQDPADAGSRLHPEDNNQDDEEKAHKALDKHDAAESVEAGLQHQQEPPQPSLEKLENDHLKRENHALAQQVKDLVADSGHHVQSLQTQLQQQIGSHNNAQREWQRQAEQLRNAQSEATDSARRSQAQVQVLEERLRQLEGPQYSNSNINSNPEPQQAAAAPTLRLTHQHQGQPAPASTIHHAVQRSVVNTAPRASGSSSASHVTRHAQLPYSDASTVRATRIGRNHSASSGSVTVEHREEYQDQHQRASTVYMTPPVNPFQCQNDTSCSDKSTHSEYSRYSIPHSIPAAPMSMRSSAYYPPQNFCNSYQQQPPNGYPQHRVGYPQPPQQQQQQLPTLISICPIPDESSGSQTTGADHSGIEKKPSSGLLAYCSGLLTSTLAPVASMTSVAPAGMTLTTSTNAKVTPAWQLFSSSAQLTKQSSLDVEQGFSPPRAHQIPLEQQHGYPLNPTSYPNYSNAPQFHQQQHQTSNTSLSSSSPPQEQASSALPLFGQF